MPKGWQYCAATQKLCLKATEEEAATLLSYDQHCVTYVEVLHRWGRMRFNCMWNTIVPGKEKKKLTLLFVSQSKRAKPNVQDFFFFLTIKGRVTHLAKWE